MRWAALYARSRQVPFTMLTIQLTTAGVWALARATGGSSLLAVLALLLGVGILAVGLSGQEPAFDATAALPWPPRRALHALLIGAVTAATAVVWQTVLGPVLPVGVVLRTCAGLLGVAALAATVFGGRHGWTLPFGWFLISFLAPHPPDEAGASRALTWMVQPGGTPQATWTAAALAIVGVACYARFGNRR
jgi:hypothetical protein